MSDNTLLSNEENAAQTFAGLGLMEDLLKALKAADHKVPSPIQAQAIPMVLDGRDVMGIAQTGTGKTAAFTLPLLQHLRADGLKAQPKKPRALILAPTRELANQIDQSIRTYAKFMNIRHGVVIGGVSQHGQVKTLNRGIDVLTACPGRLMDLMNQRCVSLEAVDYLVLDEADRMLDMGFVRDVRKIVAATRKSRLTQFFSATMTREVEALANEMLENPEKIEVTPASVPVQRIEQSVVFVEGSQKRGLLNKMLDSHDLSRVIVFTRTKHGANRLAEQLDKDGVPSDALHGNKSQSQRERALARFRRGQVRVLVATDIAARGIDVDGVSHVINYDLPNEAESYVHRIGRTARAGNDGKAISFCAPDDQDYLTDIERLLKRELADPAEDPRARRADGTPVKSGKPGRRRNRNRNRSGDRDNNRSEGGRRDGGRDFKRRDNDRRDKGRGRDDRAERAAKPARSEDTASHETRARKPNRGKPNADVDRSAPQQEQRAPKFAGKPAGKPAARRFDKDGQKPARPEGGKEGFKKSAQKPAHKAGKKPHNSGGQPTPFKKGKSGAAAHKSGGAQDGNAPRSRKRRAA